MTLRWAAAFAFGVAALCGAAVVNGGAMLFPDSLSYLSDGSALWRLDWPDNTRSPFYGLAIFPFHLERNLWPVVIVQAAILVHAIYLTARCVLDRLTPSRFALGVAVLAAAGLPWYVAHVLPDVFAGVTALCVFLLAFGWERLGRVERIWVALLAAATAAFHVSHLLVGAGLAVVAVGARLAWRLYPIRAVAPLAPSVAALAAFFSFSLLLYGTVSLSPKGPPFLLARAIADGPAAAYLHDACPEAGYALCPYVDRLPADADAFLWRADSPLRRPGVYERTRVEEARIVWESLWNAPLWHAAAALDGATRQLTTLTPPLSRDPAVFDGLARLYPRLSVTIAGTAQTRGTLSRDVVAAIQGWTMAVGGVGLLLILAAAPRRERRWRGLALIFVVALLANAAVAGALSGVSGRYQGRIAWLLPFAALLGAARLAETRRSAVTRPRPPAPALRAAGAGVPSPIRRTSGR